MERSKNPSLLPTGSQVKSQWSQQIELLPFVKSEDSQAPKQNSLLVTLRGTTKWEGKKQVPRLRDRPAQQQHYQVAGALARVRQKNTEEKGGGKRQPEASGYAGGEALKRRPWGTWVWGAARAPIPP